MSNSIRNNNEKLNVKPIKTEIMNTKTTNENLVNNSSQSHSNELKQNKMENEENKSWNLRGLTDVTSLDELFEFRDIIEGRCSDMVGGSSIEGNGFNLNITYNGKPWLLRCEIDEFHLKLRKQIEEQKKLNNE